MKNRFPAKRCPYLRPEWLEVRQRHDMHESEIVEIWARRIRAGLRIGLMRPRNGRGADYRPDRFMKSGIDNPFQTEAAHRIMLNEAIRRQRTMDAAAARSKKKQKSHLILVKARKVA